MVTLALPREIVEPPARHGVCRLRLQIGGTNYALWPVKGQPRGMVVWSLRSIDGPRAGTRYCVASVHREAGCTCPDHEINGAMCKHLLALKAIGLIPRSSRTKAECADELAARARRAPAARQIPAVADKRLARARRHHKPELGPAPPRPYHPDPVATAKEFRSAVSSHIATLAHAAQGGV
jgi:hypothetical protein